MGEIVFQLSLIFLGQPVLVEVSVSLRNILEIDEHSQVRRRKKPYLQMRCKCNLHLDGRKNTSVTRAAHWPASLFHGGKVTIAIKEAVM